MSSSKPNCLHSLAGKQVKMLR